MTLEAFLWEERFATGIALIDTQHQRLIDLVNRLGGVQLEQAAAGVVEMVAEVRAYADYHFRTEEAVWQHQGADAAEQASHRAEHHEFRTRLAELEHDFASRPLELARVLHEFLCSWLVMHILGNDQEMARRIQLDVAADVDRPEATARTGFLGPARSADAALLQAIRRLYAALSTINTELRESNRQLDARVRERTRELSASNEALARERDRLADANRQLVETRSRLLASERMASIGQLAGGVAHEINNPLAFLGTNLNTLAEYLDDVLAVVDAYAAREALIAQNASALASLRAVKEAKTLDLVRRDAASLIAESRAGVQRVKRIVQDLATFARTDRAGWQFNDLVAGVESTINLALPTIAQKAVVQRELHPLPEIRCHSGQLNQVFMILLVNAVQAMGQSGTITIRSGADQATVWVEVEDDGCGIAPENHARIFEPFFTTRPVGQGVGLGLYIAWHLVHQHRGRIELDSQPGVGSRFRVVLPRESLAGEGEEGR